MKPHIVLSFVFSLLFIWIVGYFFCDSLRPFKFDKTLNKFIHTPGIIYKQRSEGHARTLKGLYGINGIGDITKEKRKKILIWGDSYVEAHQVNDTEKIPQLTTNQLSKRKNWQNTMSIGVGMSGDSVADYYFDIPQYEMLLQDVLCHFIVITDLKDILPDQASDKKKGVFKSNPFRLSKERWTPKLVKTKEVFNTLGLYFVWKPLLSALPIVKKLDFLPKTRGIKNNKKVEKSGGYDKQFLVNSWNFLLKKLRKQTELPVVFIYCPDIPKIVKGTVYFQDTNSDYISMFRQIAKNYDIAVLDTIDEFASFYKETGLLPRGFSNSIPGKGHFNENGQKIVSDVVVRYLTKYFERK